MALKILLADDNITAQKMGSKILTDAGYTVVAVSNGAAAMKKIVSEKPDLIILDVYMPGYTGLEVCGKVKAAAETARVPVVLTVTNMEPFNAEDGNRVKADGVLIKPFEATDLLAVVHKFEEKLHPPEAEKTVKMAAVPEFDDQSYAEWKADATPQEAAVKPPEMSHEMASSPALGFEDFAPATAQPEPTVAPAAFAVETLRETAPTQNFDLSEPAPAFALDHAEAVAAPPAELEFTSAPKTAPMEIAPAAELEVTAQEAAAEVAIVQDPALVTDRSEITQFATKFGEEHPEDVPVGIAMPEPAPEEEILDIPDLVPQPMAKREAVPQTAEQALPQAVLEISGGAAAAQAREAEPEVGVDTQPLDVLAEAGAAPAVEAAAHEAYQETVEQKLVAQFAAELEAAQKEMPPEPEPAPEMEPPAEAATAVAAPDDQHVAEAVSRVLERYKDELIAAIVRELKS